MSSGDWRRPDWFADTIGAWTPSGLMPPAIADAMRPMVDLFGFAPAALAQGIIGSAASQLVGQPLTLRSGDTEISLLLRRVELERAPLGFAIGQLGNVTIEADDVLVGDVSDVSDVGDVRAAHVRLDVRNLHIQPGATTATVVAAPVHIRATLDQDVVAAALARRTTHAEIELRDDGQARIRLRGRHGWGHIDATPRIVGRSLALDPSAAALRRWDLSAVARHLPEVRVDLPEVLSGAHVTAVEVAKGRLVVDGTYEEWRAEMRPAELDDLRRQVQRQPCGVLRIPGHDASTSKGR